MATPPEEEICSLCLVQFSKYTCPKCNLRYCSLSCYKNERHAQCSEAFYRDSFMTELRQHRASGEEKDKMLNILKRLEESEELREPAEQEVGPSLEDRLADLDLDTDAEEIWDRMTSSERRQFQAMARTGQLSSHLQPERPWWEVADRRVVPLDECGGTICQLPPLPSKLPSLDSLTKGKAVSPLLCYNLLNVLYAYTYVVRLHGSEHHDLPELASQSVADISTCLSLNSSFETVPEALHAAMATVKQNKDLFNSKSFSVAVLVDVQWILCSPKSRDCHVIRALADLHKLLGAALSKLKSAKSDVHSEQRKKMWQARKKVHFFLAWASSPECSARCPGLAFSVNHEYEKESMIISHEASAEEPSRKSLKIDLTNSKKGEEAAPPHGVTTESSKRKLIEEL